MMILSPPAPGTSKWFMHKDEQSRAHVAETMDFIATNACDGMRYEASVVPPNTPIRHRWPKSEIVRLAVRNFLERLSDATPNRRVSNPQSRVRSSFRRGGSLHTPVQLCGCNWMSRLRAQVRPPRNCYFGNCLDVRHQCAPKERKAGQMSAPNVAFRPRRPHAERRELADPSWLSSPTWSRARNGEGEVSRKPPRATSVWHLDWRQNGTGPPKVQAEEGWHGDCRRQSS
jgi:hypothetical protein